MENPNPKLNFRLRLLLSAKMEFAGTGYALSERTKKLDRIYKIMFFRHWISGRTGQCSQENGKQISEPWACASLSEGKSFQAIVHGQENSEWG